MEVSHHLVESGVTAVRGGTQHDPVRESVDPVGVTERIHILATVLSDTNTVHERLIGRCAQRDAMDVATHGAIGEVHCCGALARRG
jgi:hypothetical protein